MVRRGGPFSNHRLTKGVSRTAVFWLTVIGSVEKTSPVARKVSPRERAHGS
jgi:hypothetical protein